MDHLEVCDGLHQWVVGSFLSSDSGALESIREERVHIAFGEDRVSVRHLWCWGALLRGRLTRLIRFSVCVNHGSTLDPGRRSRRMPLVTKAAAEAGSSWTGMMMSREAERCRHSHFSSLPLSPCTCFVFGTTSTGTSSACDMGRAVERWEGGGGKLEMGLGNE